METIQKDSRGEIKRDEQGRGEKRDGLHSHFSSQDRATSWAKIKVRK